MFLYSFKKKKKKRRIKKTIFKLYMNDDLGKKNSQGRGGGRQKRRYKGEGKDIKEENT